VAGDFRVRGMGLQIKNIVSKRWEKKEAPRTYGFRNQVQHHFVVIGGCIWPDAKKEKYAALIMF